MKHGKGQGRGAVTHLPFGVQLQHQDTAVVDRPHRGADDKLDLLNEKKAVVRARGLCRKKIFPASALIDLTHDAAPNSESCSPSPCGFCGAGAFFGGSFSFLALGVDFLPPLP